jgi:hypothetical protein
VGSQYNLWQKRLDARIVADQSNMCSLATGLVSSGALCKWRQQASIGTPLWHAKHVPVAIAVEQGHAGLVQVKQQQFGRTSLPAQPADPVPDGERLESSTENKTKRGPRKAPVFWEPFLFRLTMHMTRGPQKKPGKRAGFVAPFSARNLFRSAEKKNKTEVGAVR